MTGHTKRKTPAQILRAQRMAREKAFRPLAIELGWIAAEWNRLHQALGELFANLVDIDRKQMGFGIWYTSTNERAQRWMLESAIETVLKVTTPTPTWLPEIKWILQQMNGLSGRRNTAIHSPFVFFQEHSGGGAIEISPYYHYGHPRAKELYGKPLLEEFRWYRAHLNLLAEYAEDLNFAMTFPDDYTLRDRPQLPPRGHSEKTGQRRRKSSSK